MKIGSGESLLPGLPCPPFLLTVSSNVCGKKVCIYIWGCPSLHVWASFTRPQRLLLTHPSAIGCAPALRGPYLGKRSSKTLWINVGPFWQGTLGLRCPEPAAPAGSGAQPPEEMLCWSCGPFSPWECSWKRTEWAPGQGLFWPSAKGCNCVLVTLFKKCLAGTAPFTLYSLSHLFLMTTWEEGTITSTLHLRDLRVTSP